MKKILSIVLAACATLALVTGCSGTNVTVPSVTVPSEIESLVSEGKEIVNDLNIAVPTKDRAGNDIKVPEKVEKIVSMAPSTTQFLIDLGLGDKIIASAMPKPETKEERLARYRAQESMDKSLAPIKERINRLYKAKTAAEDLVILFDDELKLVSSISQLKTDVVSQREGTRISLTLSTHYKADAPSNIVMGLDGSLRAKLYTGDTYVGDAIIPLPLYGLPCNGQTRICIGFCRSYMEGKHTYSIKIEPIHLWLTERGK